MIRNFTKDDFEKLVPYEEHLTRAKFGRYVYALRRPAFEELKSVYRSLGYEQNLDYSCSSCLLNLCITLGNYYFPFKKKLEEELKEQESQKVEEVNDDANENVADEVTDDADEQIGNDANEEPEQQEPPDTDVETPKEEELKEEVKKDAEKPKKTTRKETKK